MSEHGAVNTMESSLSLSPKNNGVNDEFLKEKVPCWYREASDKRQRELSAHQLALPDWYKKASSVMKVASKESHTAYRHSLNSVEKILGGIQNPFEFAEPLLVQAIQDTFKQTLNVREVFFARKYRVGAPPRNDFYQFLVLDQETDSSLNHVYRGITLLEAALGNFEPDEAQKGSCDDCQIITRWSSYDGEVMATRSAVMEQAVSIAPEAFAELCRSLDLGRLYQEHISGILTPDDTWERAQVNTTLSSNQKHMLAVSAQAAYMQYLTPGADGVKSGISADAYRMLLQVVGDKPDITLDGRAVGYASLKMLDVELSGILLIGSDRQGSDRVERLVAYIPGDPLQPLKEYTSSVDFEIDLKARLHTSAYRLFFSRFVPQRHQGDFFRSLGRRLDPSETYAQSEDYTPIPNQRSVRLSIGENPVQGNLWEYLRQERVNKIINDARAVAVPTGDEDKQARLKKMESYISAVESVFNLAAFVVPGLGEIMLVIGAAQMMAEAFEGIEAFEQGEYREMWEHFSSVALNAAFIAAGAKVIPAINAPGVVDALKPVKMPDGKTLLWKPSLKGYEQKMPTLGTKPDDLGLHQYDGQDILPLEDEYYAVKKEPTTGQYRIQHPTRPQAYTPELNHNGSGAWIHEVELPLTWEGPELMRRLGHSVSEFSDTELEHIRIVSDTDENVLRRMHVESEPMPPLLAETIKRFNAYADAGNIRQQILDGALSKDLCGYAVSLMVELPGWPGDKAIEVMNEATSGEMSVLYGTTKVSGSSILRITRTELMEGQLPKRIIESLNETQIKDVLGQHAPQEMNARIEALRKRLVDNAEETRSQIFKRLYSDRSPVGDRNVQTIQRDFSSLPTSLVMELLADATPVELQQMSHTQRVPLRLAQKAHPVQQDVRLARAYEGLYLDALMSADTESLALHTLRKLPGWENDLCIEVRDGVFTGKLRASVGPEGAARRKVLVRTGAGQYEARNASDNHLHGRDDLYAAIQHALPDEARMALGLPHVGQGADLKALIKQQALARDELRTVLNMQPVNKPFFKPLTVLSDGRRGYPLSGRGQGVWGRVIEQRVRTLYPDFTAEELDTFIETLNAGEDSPDHQLKVLEREYKKLDHTLQTWLRAPNPWAGVRDSPQYMREWGARIKIIKVLKQAWQKSGPRDYDAYGNYRGQKIDLSQTSLQRQLLSLPALEANFDHVTRLRLNGTGFSNEVENFLGHFHKLRALDLANNNLIRFPAILSDMRHLLELHLGGNQIVLTDQTVAQLKQLTRLKVLGMERNPLALPPDISRMPDLHILNLSNTGIDTWPTGIFAAPRPRHFDLRLLDNPITQIPVVAPGSLRAEILARTLLSRDPQWLSPQNLATLKGYIESVGLDPDRRFPSSVMVESRFWTQALTPEQRASPQLRGLKRDTWRAVADEFGSEPFFNEIRKLQETADASADFRTDLAGKVWRMLEAAAEDTVLREKLFGMAAAPTTCVDAGAQLFNAMGVEVLVHEAYALASKDLVEAELINLAKGKSRLDELSKIARGRVRELEDRGRKHPEFDDNGDRVQHRDEEGNFIRDIDEVEVHLEYATDLAERLDLPWQSQRMTFLEPDVTPLMVEEAYQRVLALEEGDLLRDSIIKQDFWRTYIQGSNRKTFNGFRRRTDAALELQIAQVEWTQSTDLAERNRLREKITSLATVLGKQQGDVPPGRVMTDAEYNAELESIDAEKQGLLKKLTREAMDRAKLQRVEIPFKVESSN